MQVAQLQNRVDYWKEEAENNNLHVQVVKAVVKGGKAVGRWCKQRWFKRGSDSKNTKDSQSFDENAKYDGQKESEESWKKEGHTHFSSEK